MSEAIKSLRRTMVFSSRDWAASRDTAWLYGVVCGWDEECLRELQEMYGWDPKAWARLNELHEELEALLVPEKRGL